MTLRRPRLFIITSARFSLPAAARHGAQRRDPAIAPHDCGFRNHVETNPGFFLPCLRIPQRSVRFPQRRGEVDRAERGRAVGLATRIWGGSVRARGVTCVAPQDMRAIRNRSAVSSLVTPSKVRAWVYCVSGGIPMTRLDYAWLHLFGFACIVIGAAIARSNWLACAIEIPLALVAARALTDRVNDHLRRATLRHE